MIHPVYDQQPLMLWLYDLPIWLFALVTIAFFVVLGLIGLRLTHRRINEGTFATLIDNGTVGWFFSGVTVLYGLLLGLLTVATWSNFTQATGIASKEAATIAVLYRNFAGYPTEQRLRLQQSLRNYTEFIVHESWPLQRKGLIHDGESDRLIQLQTIIQTIEPATEGKKILQAESIRAFTALVELRRLRMESITGSVPGVIWYVVLLGAVLTLVFSYFFLVKDIWFHALLIAMLATVIGLLIFLIAALDHPYRGSVSVESTAYQLVLDKVMKP